MSAQHHLCSIASVQSEWLGQITRPFSCASGSSGEISIVVQSISNGHAHFYIHISRARAPPTLTHVATQIVSARTFSNLICFADYLTLNRAIHIGHTHTHTQNALRLYVAHALPFTNLHGKCDRCSKMVVSKSIAAQSCLLFPFFGCKRFGQHK